MYWYLLTIKSKGGGLYSNHLQMWVNAGTCREECQEASKEAEEHSGLEANQEIHKWSSSFQDQEDPRDPGCLTD